MGQKQQQALNRSAPIRGLSEVFEKSANGHHDSFDRLFTLIYNDFRGLAKGYLAREVHADTLQATALVNEAAPASSTTLTLRHLGNKSPLVSDDSFGRHSSAKRGKPWMCGLVLDRTRVTAEYLLIRSPELRTDDFSTHADNAGSICP